jgi:hypothetical protein
MGLWCNQAAQLAPVKPFRNKACNYENHKIGSYNALMAQAKKNEIG